VAALVTRSLFSPAYRRLRNWLIDARHARSLTQAQLAYALGRPQSFVSKYERGERRLDFVEVLEIVDALHVDVRDLVLELRRQST
jgi:transcriptional regulator with XRE-family HTH domain